MSSEDIGYYIHNITINWRKSVTAIIEVADLVVEAEDNLSVADWYHMKNAKDFTFSDSWISKMKLISRSKRFKTKTVRSRLPANYSLLYQYARLSDDEWQKAIQDESVVSPDATLKMLMEWLIDYRHNKHTTTETNGSFLRLNQGFFAGFTLPTNLNEQTEKQIKIVIEEAQKKLNKLGVDVVYADSPTPQKNITDDRRTRIADDLSSQLNKKLAKKSSLTFREVEQIESVLWQHKHHTETGKYPYPSDHKESIENPSHHRYVKSWNYSRVKDDLNQMKKDGKLPITSYTPIRLWKDMTEEKCMKYVIEHCRAVNRDNRYRYKSLLQDVAISRGREGQLGKKYLSMLVG